jgi:hypothetical protein
VFPGDDRTSALFTAAINPDSVASERPLWGCAEFHWRLWVAAGRRAVRKASA